MPRSENIRADIARIGSMPDEEFAEKWGAWARSQDRDLERMRSRWIEDLERMLPFAEREDEASEELVAAKDAYRDDPSAENRERKQMAVMVIQAIRAEERADRGNRHGIVGDAFVNGA